MKYTQRLTYHALCVVRKCFNFEWNAQGQAAGVVQEAVGSYNLMTQDRDTQGLRVATILKWTATSSLISLVLAQSPCPTPKAVRLSVVCPSTTA